jgi:hypothetical protein
MGFLAAFGALVIVLLVTAKKTGAPTSGGFVPPTGLGTPFAPISFVQGQKFTLLVTSATGAPLFPESIGPILNANGFGVTSSPIPDTTGGMTNQFSVGVVAAHSGILGMGSFIGSILVNGLIVPN